MGSLWVNRVKQKYDSFFVTDRHVYRNCWYNSCTSRKSSFFSLLQHSSWQGVLSLSATHNSWVFRPTSEHCFAPCNYPGKTNLWRTMTLWTLLFHPSELVKIKTGITQLCKTNQMDYGQQVKFQSSMPTMITTVTLSAVHRKSKSKCIKTLPVPLPFRVCKRPFIC